MNNGSSSLSSTGKVQLVFEFHTARQFTGLTLHLARPPASDSSAPPTANNNKTIKSRGGLAGCLVHFAVHRANYLGKVVRAPIIPNTQQQQPQQQAAIYDVAVDLKGRVGRYLKLELEFDGQWLLMSEVSFQSIPHDGNVTAHSPEAEEEEEEEEEEEDAMDANPSEEEGPEIPIIDDSDGGSHDDDDDIFEEISTVAEDQRTAYIGLVGGVLSIVVLLLGTGLVVYLKRRKNRHGKQVAAILHPGGSSCGVNGGLSGDGLNKLSLTPRQSSSSGESSSKQRMTLLSLKQLGHHHKANSNLAPSARDGFYGPVMSSMATGESDSDTSSFYHEPYQQQQQQQMLTGQVKYSSHNHGRGGGGGFQRSYCSSSSAADPEYGCLIQKEPLLLTPKGLHSKGLFHHSAAATLSATTNNTNNNHSFNPLLSAVATMPPAMPLPRPPLSSSAVKPLLMTQETSSTNTMSSTTTTFTALPSENYYATTDLILVSFNFSFFNSFKFNFKNKIK
jgi:hypothetical protein